MIKKKLLLSVTFLLAAANAQAEDKWYDIEVVFFKHLKDESLHFEQWDDQLHMKLDPTAYELLDPKTGEALDEETSLLVNEDLIEVITNPVVSVLEEKDRFLTEEAEKVDNYHATKVIAHLAWRQLFTDESKVKLHLFGGKDFAENFDFSGRRRSIEMPVKVSEEGEEPPRETIQVHPFDVSSVFHETLNPTELRLWQIDGFLEIQLLRYMHIDADFVVRTPIVDRFKSPLASVDAKILEDESVTPPLLDKKKEPETNDIITVERLKQYNLQQSIKVKSHDLSYMDHPLLGVFVAIRPYKPLEESLDTRLEQ